MAGMSSPRAVFVRQFARSFPVAFLICLVLSRVGPFSSDTSFLRSLVESLVLSAFVTGALTWVEVRQKKTPCPVVELDDSTAARVDALLNEGKLVDAVKAVRDSTGAGLVEAKNTVDVRATRRMDG